MDKEENKDIDLDYSDLNPPMGAIQEIGTI